MVAQTKFYKLGDEHSAQEWGSIVATLAHGRKMGERVVEQTYLDTFDWAACRAGITIITENDGALSLHLMEDGKRGKYPNCLPVEKTPVWPSDIPAGKMQNKLAKLAGLRSFMALAQVKSEQIILAVEDKKGRVRVRLIVECNFQRPAPRRKMIELGCRLRIECLAGYEKDFAKTWPIFEGLTASSQQEHFNLIMSNAGKTPKDYTSKLNIKLERDMRSDEALKTILLDQLIKIECTLEGTMKNIDTEFLHDLRVAVRRSRSALSRMKGVLPQTMQDRFSQELQWIGSITTPVRDLDVYMLDFPKYRAQLSVEQQENLQPLYEFLCSQHKMARTQLIKEIESRRFKDFLVKWRTYLEKPVPQRPTALAAILPVGGVADKRIWKTYRRVMTEGKAIGPQTPAEALHDMRKTCKKLRYLLEFFVSLYPSEQVTALVKSLKGLQQNLGDFQDLDVQAEALNDYSTQMMSAGENRPQVFMSMGVLVEGFMRRKVEVREEFYERFGAFASPEVELEFRKLSGHEKKKKVTVKA
ncbi:putative CHAD domain containing protein [Candidatus Terasakiella magnetica]|uniref:Putative CHAD domain containing protein n=1 Tax=Candidatus Terasakiella magnetica TaxID=1867952 RepID=A0A1C3REC6_9PROT|nr:CHAD domain-containing protein [Candidatus Terasakiella magnetica]SCA55591.1 putative CHAD domain containing protein [Candidatus Terasakiella magnetica]